MLSLLRFCFLALAALCQDIKFTVHDCSSLDVGTEEDYFVLFNNVTNSPTGPQCRAVSDLELPDDEPTYAASVALSAHSLVYPGLMFNVAEDEFDFDFVFFRVNEAEYCVQGGHFGFGSIDYGRVESCADPPATGQWFNVSIKVVGRAVTASYNGEPVYTSQTQYDPTARVGVVAMNTVLASSSGSSSTSSSSSSRSSSSSSGSKVDHVLHFRGLTLDFVEEVYTCWDCVTPVYRDGAHYVLEGPASTVQPLDAGARAFPAAESSTGTTFNVQVDLRMGSWVHPGVVYNAADSLNYDVVFFRVGQTTSCLQTGHVTSGRFSYGAGADCSAALPADAFFNVQVQVRGSDVTITAGDSAVTFTGSSHFPPEAGHMFGVTGVKPNVARNPARATRSGPGLSAEHVTFFRYLSLVPV